MLWMESLAVTTMFKLALGAGHKLDTPGKRCLKSIDPKETGEWVLNDRICDKVQKLLAEYDGIEVLRVDDTEGKKAISVAARNNAANNWGADYALAVHHNAGIKGGSGGGIVVYRYPGNDPTTVAWQNEMYDALIKHTGLKGNRANPKTTANLLMLNGTRMPATLLELGFMDSTTDVPIILTDDYATKCAKAIVEVIVNRAGLVKKNQGGKTFRVKVKAKTPIYKDTGTAAAGVYTITEEKNGMGRLKSGQGWINLSGSIKL